MYVCHSHDLGRQQRTLSWKRVRGTPTHTHVTVFSPSCPVPSDQAWGGSSGIACGEKACQLPSGIRVQSPDTYLPGPALQAWTAKPEREKKGGLSHSFLCPSPSSWESSVWKRLTVFVALCINAWKHQYSTFIAKGGFVCKCLKAPMQCVTESLSVTLLYA